MKLQYVMLVLVGLAVSGATYGQVKEPESLSDALDKIENANQVIKGVLEKSIMGKIKPTFDQATISESVPDADEEARQELLKYYDEFNNDVKKFEDFTQVAREVENQISLIGNDLLNQSTLNPISEALGKSFVDVVMTNAEATLKKVAPKPNTFKKILTAVVGNPVVKTLLGTNPITAMASDAINQYISHAEGEVDQKEINNFKNSLQPHIDFYGEFNRGAENLQAKLASISVSVQSRKRKIEKAQQAVRDLLATQGAGNDELRLKKMFGIDRISSLKSAEVTAILLSSNVRNLARLVEKHNELLDGLTEDRLDIVNAYNPYIDAIIKTLEGAKDNTSLGFSTQSIDQHKMKYRKIS